jgi:hypothetical protein
MGADGVSGVGGSVTDCRNLTIQGCADAGITVDGASSLLARNCIVIRNRIGLEEATGTQIFSSYNNVFNNSDFDLFNVTAGTGDLSADVAFLDESGGDFRVSAGSVTIDAGDPADAFSNEPSPNGFRINMGAFGNTADATVSPVVPSSGGGGSSGGGCVVESAANGNLVLLLLGGILLWFELKKRLSFCRS